MFMPAAPHYSSNLVGTYFKRDSHKPGFGLASWQGEMDIASGEVLWERIYPEELRTDAGCEAPLYAPELPNPWEVDDYRALRRSSARAGGFVPPHSVQDYASTPKSYSRILRFDEREWLWVLTNRNRYDFSYLDIYSDTAFVGAVRIRDRAEGFDVLGSTLAVLVDRRVLPAALFSSSGFRSPASGTLGPAVGPARFQSTPGVRRGLTGMEIWP